MTHTFAGSRSTSKTHHTGSACNDMPSSTHLRQDATDYGAGATMYENKLETVIGELINSQHGKEKRPLGMKIGPATIFGVFT